MERIADVVAREARGDVDHSPGAKVLPPNLLFINDNHPRIVVVGSAARYHNVGDEIQIDNHIEPEPWGEHQHRVGKSQAIRHHERNV